MGCSVQAHTAHRNLQVAGWRNLLHRGLPGATSIPIQAASRLVRGVRVVTAWWAALCRWWPAAPSPPPWAAASAAPSASSCSSSTASSATARPSGEPARQQPLSLQCMLRRRPAQLPCSNETVCAAPCDPAELPHAWQRACMPQAVESACACCLARLMLTSQPGVHCAGTWPRPATARWPAWLSSPPAAPRWSPGRPPWAASSAASSSCPPASSSPTSSRLTTPSTPLWCGAFQRWGVTVLLAAADWSAWPTAAVTKSADSDLGVHVLSASIPRASTCCLWVTCVSVLQKACFDSFHAILCRCTALVALLAWSGMRWWPTRSLSQSFMVRLCPHHAQKLAWLGMAAAIGVHLYPLPYLNTTCLSRGSLLLKGVARQLKAKGLGVGEPPDRGPISHMASRCPGTSARSMDESWSAAPHAGADPDGNQRHWGWWQGDYPNVLGANVVWCLVIFGWTFAMMAPFFYLLKLCGLLRISPEEEEVRSLSLIWLGTDQHLACSQWWEVGSMMPALWLGLAVQPAEAEHPAQAPAQALLTTPLYSLLCADLCCPPATSGCMVPCSGSWAFVVKIDGLLCSWALISASMEVLPIQVGDLNALPHSMAALILSPFGTRMAFMKHTAAKSSLDESF